MKVNLHPKPMRYVPAAAVEDRTRAVTTYGNRARDLLDRSGSDPIGAISLLMLAADQRKQAAEDAEPSLSEQALAQTIRDQRDTIDALTAERDKFEKWWKDAVHEATSLNADLCQQEVDADQITQLQSILRAVTASDGVFARLYTDDLRALPNGTVVRDEYGRAWTRIDDEDGGVWATPSEDTTMPSSYLTAKSAVYLAWVAAL